MKKHLIPSLLTIVFSVLFIVPVILLLIQASMPAEEAALVARGVSPIKLWPSSFSLEQFSILFSAYGDFWRRFCHDLIWCVAISLVQVFLSIVDGYILAKYRNRFISILTVVFTLTMMIPIQIFLIPTYRMAQGLGVVNRSFILYLPLAFTPVGTLLMRQISLRVPDEWIEYLRLEGGEFPQLLFYVLMPHCKLSASVVFLISFVECWGMVEQPLILLTNEAAYPLSMLLYDMRISQPQIIFAASTMALIPILIFIVLLPLSYGIRNTVKLRHIRCTLIKTSRGE